MLEEQSKSYRIKANVGQDSYLSVKLDQDYDTFEVLSIKVKGSDAYRLHNSNYGIIVGRVLANGGFGIPNAKISVFIEADTDNDTNKILALYGYTDTMTTNSFGNTYNLLPNAKVDDCHQVIGSFPTKRYLLDDETYIEVFDKYYKYTTRTNNAGDYMLCGVPTGSQKLHMDLDLSDCGILSQRPRDFVYKGYTVEQFENANQFKQASGASINNLSQYVKQEETVYVYPFWGDSSKGDTIGITRADIDVNFKFEPTCVFMGSIVSDNQSNGISKKCVPTNTMGAMDELVSGKGTIEMIRKTASGAIEEFEIKGNELIDGDGTWCYQIPMNLDYVVTDEYGNIVATDDPDKGIPTRTRVRFRVSMDDFEGGSESYFRGKFLVPNNPQTYNGAKLNKCVTPEDFTATHEEYDYDFGTYTNDESFRDLFWNNVYTVKSYIPRFQKSRSWRNERFTGIKHSNIAGNNNNIPYNSIRIRLPFMFVLMCALIKAYIRIVGFINLLINITTRIFARLSRVGVLPKAAKNRFSENALSSHYITVADGLCPDLETWYFAPTTKGSKYSYCVNAPSRNGFVNLCSQTLNTVSDYDATPDNQSVDNSNSDDMESICLTKDTDYLISCIEMNLAQEYKVINFDFYNDWVNGLIYMPRWYYRNPRKVKFWGLFTIKIKEKGCISNKSVFGNTRLYTQQCAMDYSLSNGTYSKITTSPGCDKKKNKKQLCHKKPGKKTRKIFGSNGGIITPYSTLLGQKVYYYKPCEWGSDGRKTILFATDLVLLGSLNSCSNYGIPQAFKLLRSSSYIMPTNLALTNMDEDGALYATKDGTFCTGTANTGYTSNASDNKITTASTSYSGTQQYYSTLSGSSSDLGDNNTDTQDTGSTDYEDAIAITEAAGIAWNYTGPGQGTPSSNIRKSLYLPGGHFLGISCTNSQTNIKSCVNLQRICEAGASMSQRREEVRKFDSDTQRANYTYYIPTGLISNDDITSESFRNMFSTMNINRLIATGIDENTGYLKYNFSYVGSAGFDGTLKNKISTDSNYNKQVDVLDENDDLVNNSGSTTSDSYDVEESANTYAKTTETNNIGYYRFRLGLNDLSTSGIDMDNRYLLGVGNSGRALPQYENSYYFYFGIKDGSTALDRLYSDFFATCAKEDDSYYPVIYVDEEDFDKCENKGKLSFMVTDMIAPYSITIKDNDTNTIIQTFTSSRDTFSTPEELESGSYLITITDSNGAAAIKKIKFGETIVNVISDLNDFEFKIEQGALKEDISNSAITYDSGYIKIYRYVTIDGKSYDINDFSASTADICLDVVVHESGVTSPTEYGYASVLNIEGDSSDIDKNGKKYGDKYGKRLPYTVELKDDDYYYVYLWGTGLTYEVIVGFRCGDNEYSSYITTTTNKSTGYGLMDLYMGSKMLPYNTKNSEGFRLYDYCNPKEADMNTWWENLVYASSPDREDAGDFTMWALQQQIFKQSLNSADTFNCATFCTDVYGNEIDGVLFGTPENENGVIRDAVTQRAIYSENDSKYYAGYSLTDVYAIFETSTKSRTSKRKYPYQKMTIDYGKNIILSDKIDDIEITEYYTGATMLRLVVTGDSIENYENRAVIVYNGNDSSYIYGVITKTGLTSSYFIKAYPTSYTSTNFNDLSKLDIYFTFLYPIIEKPFYGEMNCVVWNNATITLDDDSRDVSLEKYDSVLINELKVYNPILFGYYKLSKGTLYSLSESSLVNGVNYYNENSGLSEKLNIKFNQTSNTVLTTGNTSIGGTFKQVISEGVEDIGFDLIEGNPFDWEEITAYTSNVKALREFRDYELNEATLTLENAFSPQIVLKPKYGDGTDSGTAEIVSASFELESGYDSANTEFYLINNPSYDGKDNNSVLKDKLEEYGFWCSNGTGQYTYSGGTSVLDSLLTDLNSNSVLSASTFITYFSKKDSERYNKSCHVYEIYPDGETKYVKNIKETGNTDITNVVCYLYSDGKRTRNLSYYSGIKSIDNGNYDYFGKHFLIIAKRTYPDNEESKNKIVAYRIYFAQGAVEDNDDRVGWL